MCPTNPIATVDIYMANNHGSPTSDSAALLHGVRPRVAIMQNGARKGGSVPALQVLETSPSLEDIWQLHWSYPAGLEHNAPGVFIANLDDAATIAAVLTAPGGRGGGGAGAHSPAYYLKVSAQSDGTFRVTNTRNQFSKHLPEVVRSAECEVRSAQCAVRSAPPIGRANPYRRASS